MALEKSSSPGDAECEFGPERSDVHLLSPQQRWDLLLQTAETVAKELGNSLRKSNPGICTLQ